MNEKRSEWIDSFKGMAMLGVFLVHCGDWILPELHFLNRNGNRGVELFFLITGFLTCCKPPEINTKKEFCIWILRKYIRIMPLAIIAYALGYLFNYINSAGEMFASLRWNYKNNPEYTNLFSVIVSLTPICFLFPQNINSYVGGYFLTNILYALFYKKINTKEKNVCVCLVCMMLMLLVPESVIKLCECIGVNETKWLHYFEVKIRGIYCFSIGMCIHSFKMKIDIIKKSCLNVKEIANCGTCFACVALLYGFKKYENWNSVYIMLFVTIIIICQLLHENILFINKVWSSIGKYSYAFYYVHIPFVWYLCGKFNTKIAVILGFIGSVLLSKIITDYIEKPIIRYLNRFLILH